MAGSGARDGDGPINPAKFVVKSSDLAALSLEHGITKLRAMGRGLAQDMDEIASEWDELRGHYRAPSAGAVLDLMVPAKADARAVAGQFGLIAAQLDSFAQEMAAIKPQLAALESEAQAFHDKVQGGVEVKNSDDSKPFIAGTFQNPFMADTSNVVKWNEDPSSVAKNNEPLGQYASLITSLSQAAADAANQIARSADAGGPVCTVPDPGKARFRPVFTSDDLYYQQNAPWGHPVEVHRNWVQQMFDGAEDFANGFTSLVGVDVKNNRYGWDVAGPALGGAANFIGSLIIFVATSTGGNGAFQHKSAVGKWVWDRDVTAVGGIPAMGNVDLEAHLAGGDGLHAWRDKGWKAGTSTFLNVASLLAPIKGVRAIEKAGGIGEVSRAAADAAKTNIKRGRDLTRKSINTLKRQPKNFLALGTKLSSKTIAFIRTVEEHNLPTGLKGQARKAVN